MNAASVLLGIRQRPVVFTTAIQRQVGPRQFP